MLLKCARLINALSNDLARHARFRRIDQRLLPKCIHLDTQLLRQEFARLTARVSVAGNNGRRVYFHLHQLVRASQKFRSDEDDGCCPISNLLVLFLRQIHENLGSGVLDSDERKDSSTVV